MEPIRKKIDALDVGQNIQVTITSNGSVLYRGVLVGRTITDAYVDLILSGQRAPIRIEIGTVRRKWYTPGRIAFDCILGQYGTCHVVIGAQ